MTSEMFVVWVLRDSVWIDAAEIDGVDGEFRAFRVCEGLRALGLDAKVVHRWVGANPLAPGECVLINSCVERFQPEVGSRARRGEVGFAHRSTLCPARASKGN